MFRRDFRQRHLAKQILHGIRRVRVQAPRPQLGAETTTPPSASTAARVTASTPTPVLFTASLFFFAVMTVESAMGK